MAFGDACTFSTVMLKKIFAKLREKISPARASKPAHSESGKSAHAKSHATPHRAEPRSGRGHGQGQKSHGSHGGRSSDSHRGKSQGGGHGPSRDSHEPRGQGQGSRSHSQR